ncbi:MAG TPA: AAA family ATPase [Terracidiphilus sp.]|jgi:AAA+ ATPase superfamily predicted ATPase
MRDQALKFKNPFRPGAGHIPPHLAGREAEIKEFKELLEQDVILNNVILTGLRGVGKTVLLERLKPMAIQAGWLWTGTDLSESTSITEDHMTTRLVTDLSVLTSAMVIKERASIGFSPTQEITSETLNFQVLKSLYDSSPGLAADKLKSVLETIWPYVQSEGRRGIIFAYDEAQNLADHAAKDQYPLSLLLDVFQSLQRKGVCFMLVLTGLPTLFPKLVEARTYTERMFHTIFLQPLNEEQTQEAIVKPIQKDGCPVSFTIETVSLIWTQTRGYPYFIQYICREVYDVWVQAADVGNPFPGVPVQPIMRKLDSDFFAGRWGRVTDRQRQLMAIIAMLPNPDEEFSVQDIVESEDNVIQEKPFSGSHANQMLSTLIENGLIYKNRHGKYLFAVPLLGDFIKRQSSLFGPWA